MSSSPDAIDLITTISKTIANTGTCVIADRRLELIYAGAADLELKLHRLRLFGWIHGWNILSRLNGRAAVFSPAATV